MTYWNWDGVLQHFVDHLQQLIPDSGPVAKAYTKNKALERFRKASNLYYRLYNDGDVTIGTRKMFGLQHFYKDRNGRYSKELYDAVEDAMTGIIKQAMAEQYPHYPDLYRVD